VNDAHAERFRAQVELDGALAAPWADRWRSFALNQEDGVHLTKPVDLLFEHLVAHGLPGEIVPDRWDVAEAVDLVGVVYELVTATAGSESRLHGLAIHVSPDGSVEVLTGPADPAKSRVAIDVPAYRRAEAEYINSGHDQQQSASTIRAPTGSSVRRSTIESPQSFP